MSKQKDKYVSKITTGIPGLNGLLNNSWDETVAAIYVVVKLSLIRPDIGENIISTLDPLIKLWRKEHYGVRDEIQLKEIKKWICFCDNPVTKKLLKKGK